MADLIKSAFFLMVLLLAHATIANPPLPDPTRPAAAITPITSEQVHSGVQTIVIPKNYKRLQSIAIINGEQVHVGSQWGNGQVLKISENEVVIQEPEGVKVLKVTPEVSKQFSARKPKRITQ